MPHGPTMYSGHVNEPLDYGPWTPPPHVIIQPHSIGSHQVTQHPMPLDHETTWPEPPVGSSAARSSTTSNRLHHVESHLKRHLDAPGVENDPSARGPGRIGMGTHWVKPPSRPLIPGATIERSWKTPYSYGFFGGSGRRHWTRQTGYRDRFLQWTLR
ncbi:MAG: hypothetical protein AAGC97_15075 [Planctomycetota bacterium]